MTNFLKANIYLPRESMCVGMWRVSLFTYLVHELCHHLKMTNSLEANICWPRESMCVDFNFFRSLKIPNWNHPIFLKKEKVELYRKSTLAFALVSINLATHTVSAFLWITVSRYFLDTQIRAVFCLLVYITIENVSVWWFLVYTLNWNTVAKNRVSKTQLRCEGGSRVIVWWLSKQTKKSHCNLPIPILLRSCSHINSWHGMPSILAVELSPYWQEVQRCTSQTSLRR